MARFERFTFLCNPNEQCAIAELAARLQRYHELGERL